MRSAITTMIFVICISGSLKAETYKEWVVKTDGPDVFGNTSVFAENFKDNGEKALIVQCNQIDDLRIVYLEKKAKVRKFRTFRLDS